MGSESGVASVAGPRRIADLNGPRGWPLVGNLHQLDLPRLHKQLEALTKIYGPIFRMRFGTRDVVVLARTDLIKSILRDRPDGWRRLKKMRDVVCDMGPDGLFSVEGEAWRRQRRLVTAAFTPGHLQRFFPLVEKVTSRLKAVLDVAASRNECIDLQKLLMRYTVDVTASLAFGIDFNTLEQADNPLQEHLDKLFPMVLRRMFAPFPIWRYIKLPADHEFDRHLAAGHVAVRNFIHEARDRMAKDPALFDNPTNALEAMLAARDGTDQLSEADLIGNVFTMLLAGEDTTANTLAWTLYLLHSHESIWRDVVAEVDAVLGPSLVPPSFHSTESFTLVDDCSSESMRLRPVAPLLFFENNAPAMLGTLELPTNTFVLCVMHTGAVDTSAALDATAFRPSRWRDAAEDAGEQKLSAASIPFGAGPRICPGRYLAMLEMRMVLATIARNYHLVEVGTADGSPPIENLTLTMAPLGLRLRVRARHDNHVP